MRVFSRGSRIFAAVSSSSCLLSQGSSLRCGAGWVRVRSVRPTRPRAYPRAEAWGGRYFQWTACYIAHAHSGTTGSCP